MREGFFLFDTHTHVGTARHSGRRYAAADLLAAMDRYGVDRSVVIPFPVVDDFRAAHEEIAEAVQAHPDRLTGSACIPPYIPESDFRAELRRCRESFGFRALKLQPQYQAVNPLWPSSEFLFEACEEHGLTLIWHTGSGIPYALPSLLMPAARRHANLKIVLAHCGGGGLLVGEAIVAAQFCPNIYLEVSSLMPNHVHEVLAGVPAGRVMAGSDLPENLEVEMGKILGMQISTEAKASILGLTAQAVFGEAA